VDSVDVKLLRDFMQDSSDFGYQREVRKSFSSVAQKLHLDEDTVRKRVEKLRNDGFLQGWRLMINPVVLGHTATALWFGVQPPSSKEDVVRKLALVEGVFLIISHFSGSLTVCLLGEDEDVMKDKTELISRISNAENLLRLDMEFPPCALRLTGTDWEIVSWLIRDSRRPFALISRELHISTRTVKRRVARMVAGQALFSFFIVNIKALKSGLSVELLVNYGNPERRKEVGNAIVKRFDDVLIRAGRGTPQTGHFSFVVPNMQGAQEILSWTRNLEGVVGAKMFLGQESFDLVAKAFGKLVERRLREEKPLSVKGHYQPTPVHR
jgi:DNA-binding Lrp family transcriptional regulator